MMNEYGEPLHLMLPNSRILVRISVRANGGSVRQPDAGFLLRNHLGLDFSGMSAAAEGRPASRPAAGQTLTVDFRGGDSGALSRGVLIFALGRRRMMSVGDWIDNAMTVQMARGEGPVYGYVHWPGRIELNSALKSFSGAERGKWLSLPASASFPDWSMRICFNEHLARYRFAARFAARCCTCWMRAAGRLRTAEFGAAASVTACDISAEASGMRSEHFGRPGVRFLQAPAKRCPSLTASFDLVTAFEVIEHLEHGRSFSSEANRVSERHGRAAGFHTEQVLLRGDARRRRTESVPLPRV